MKRRDLPFNAFRPATVRVRTVAEFMAGGLTQQEAEYAVEHSRKGTHWLNNIYNVHRVACEPSGDRPAMIWLSIKRIDRRPIHDWRHLQWIKNALIGPEHEAVELYPAESRLADSANQYHLWALADPAMRFPFGFADRLVCGPDEGPQIGARQRPFDNQETTQ